MNKSVYIAEKPSVAQEFAKALGLRTKRGQGFLESEEAIITWCVGHLVTMSYPEVYDEKLKRWSLDTLPFLPEEFKYEVIPAVAKQFQVVKEILNRKDVDTIYVCTDSGREGEYIYRLVEQLAKVEGKTRKRVWIDSQTEDEILRGIREAKNLEEYDNLSASAYLRAKEDYLMGINFSRLLSLKYGNNVANFLNQRYTSIAVGRVMTCVLGMVVKREREIREFVKMPFYRVLATHEQGSLKFEGEWRVSDGSSFHGIPDLYKENGFKVKERAEELITLCKDREEVVGEVISVEKKTEKKNPPLLYNLAELQNECAKRFKISPDETLKIVQELYEKKMVTYPRTDARVLSSAVAKEIFKNLNGLANYEKVSHLLSEIAKIGSHKKITSTRYVDDKQVTDHYAIIPTGQGIQNVNHLANVARGVYDIIVLRFLSIFYPPAIYQKIGIVSAVDTERFFANFKVLKEEGYLKVIGEGAKQQEGEESNHLFEEVSKIRKGMKIPITEFEIKEGETTPPKRYNSGSIILAMENAGQLIEDEELRAQIKGSGIGTSATRAEILKKLVHIKYLKLNKKTQIITPELLGEMIFDVVNQSIRALLNPELTASWEKGLTYVANGEITSEEYMVKLEGFILQKTNSVMSMNQQYALKQCFANSSKFYKKKG